jgi:hypothetical protein
MNIPGSNARRGCGRMREESSPTAPLDATRIKYSRASPRPPIPELGTGSHPPTAGAVFRETVQIYDTRRPRPTNTTTTGALIDILSDEPIRRVKGSPVIGLKSKKDGLHNLRYRLGNRGNFHNSLTVPSLHEFGRDV